MRILISIVVLMTGTQSLFAKDSKSEKQDAHFVLGLNYQKGASYSLGSDPATQEPKDWSLTSEGFIAHFGMVGSSGLAILCVFDYMDSYSDRDDQTKTRDFSQTYMGLGFAVGYDGPYWKLLLQGTQGKVQTSASIARSESGYDANSVALIWGYNLLKGDSAGSVYIFTELKNQYRKGDSVPNDIVGHSTSAAMLGFGMQFNADSTAVELIKLIVDSRKNK